MSSERESILPKSPETPVATTSNSSAVYHDSSQSPAARNLQIVFVVLVILMVLITTILSIVQGVKATEDGFMYFMLAVNLVALSSLEIVMVMFVRRGDLPKGKTWFLYFVGGAVILEAIFTDVAVMH